MKLPRLRHARQASDKGFGLPELLVSMVVFGIVVAAIAAVFVNSIDTVRFVSTKTATTADARIAMEAMTRSLRVAIAPTGVPSAIVEADSAHIVFYSSLKRESAQAAKMATRMTYGYDQSKHCLEERQVRAMVNPDSSQSTTMPYVWPTANETTRCLIRTNAPPRFDYFDAGRILEDDGVTEIAPLSMPPNGWNISNSAHHVALNSIVSVQISLNVQDPAALDINGTAATDRVTLVNVLVARDLDP